MLFTNQKCAQAAVEQRVRQRAPLQRLPAGLRRKPRRPHKARLAQEGGEGVSERFQAAT